MDDETDYREVPTKNGLDLLSDEKVSISKEVLKETILRWLCFQTSAHISKFDYGFNMLWDFLKEKQK